MTMTTTTQPERRDLWEELLNALQGDAQIRRTSLRQNPEDRITIRVSVPESTQVPELVLALTAIDGRVEGVGDD